MHSLRAAARFGVAAVIASIISVGSANAASLFLGGSGSTTTLGSGSQPFDPSGLAGINADGINNGTTVTYYTSPGNSSNGLFVSPSNVTLRFDYMGKEAGYTNETVLVFGDEVLFDTSSGVPGTTSSGPRDFSFGSSPTLVPFYFKTLNNTPLNTSDDKSAYNGSPIDTGLAIAFACLASGDVCYAFFDDGGAGPDRDWDDLVVRISATSHDIPQTPAPAALPLFASGLGVLGWAIRRKKTQSAARA
jgi:hypothetical protein